MALALLLCLPSGCNRRNQKLHHKVRIGTNNSPPFNYYDAQGRATGFAIDVMNRAAERAGIELEWVITREGPDVTFASGRADLWPVVTVFADRRGRMHMTEPWWRLGTVMYSRESSAIKRLEDLRGKKVVVTSPSKRFLPKILFPPTTSVEVVQSPHDGMKALCLGQAEAAFIDLRVADGVLLNRPRECGMQTFWAEMMADAVREFAIGARRGFEPDAERLRAAIDEMGLEGELVPLAAKWRFIDQTDTALIQWLDQTREKSERWRWTVVWLGAVVGFGLVVLVLLARARSRAESSARARAQFLANMSHELRTPMHGVLGLTELALGTDLDADQRRYLTLARDSAERLLHVVDDILDLSRIESGKMELEQIAFDPRELVNRALLILSLRAQEKAIDLTAQVDPAVPALLAGDPSRIHQVLVNLINNGIKFTERGSVVLRVGGQREPDDRFTISFAVEDTGIGIPREQQKRIFESFTQADASTTRRYGGSGLGLAISSHLVRMMHGKLGLLSQEGQGSTFHFELTLPVAHPTAAAEAVPETGPQRHLRLLVADDNVVNRTLLERILTRWGHRVDTAENGEQAVAACAHTHYDAVLMDVHMPVLDGLEATRQIRLREQNVASAGRHVPIVALTALAFRDDAERCHAAGMDAYLAKPFKSEQLLALLARLDQESAANADDKAVRSADTSTGLVR